MSFNFVGFKLAFCWRRVLISFSFLGFKLTLRWRRVLMGFSFQGFKLTSRWRRVLLEGFGSFPGLQVRCRIPRTAGCTYEVELGTLCLLHCNPEAFAMLPHVASFTGDAVGPIVNPAVYAAYAVKHPVLRLAEGLKCFFPLLHCLL